VTRFQAAHVSPAEIHGVVGSIENGGWRIGDDGGRMADEQSDVLTAVPSLGPSRRIALPWPVNRLTRASRGGM
jgi:hypothetical protein